ncbi:MAG: hypothetical protein MRY49_02515 [Candidatus Pacebacteria bacterium]|nr:hypothetical protein [Candidatus Paceibacterota bacterium]
MRKFMLLVLCTGFFFTTGCGAKTKSIMSQSVVFDDYSEFQVAWQEFNDPMGLNGLSTVAQVREPACGPDGQVPVNADGKPLKYNVSMVNHAVHIESGWGKQATVAAINAAGFVGGTVGGAAVLRPNKTYVRAGNADAFVSNTNDSSSISDVGVSNTVGGP